MASEPSGPWRGLLGLALILAMGFQGGAAAAQPLPDGLALPLPQGPRVEPQATPLGRLPSVEVLPLDAPARDAVGLVPTGRAGLPADLWRGSSGRTLARHLSQMPPVAVPAVRDLLLTLIELEADPPDTGRPQFLLARIDMLIALGALDRAAALLDRAGSDTPALFARRMDAALLTGTEDRACATLQAQPYLAPDPETRIFCLARAGRWTTAALSLETALALGTIAPESRDRLARFLDPDLFEGEPPLPVPQTADALTFRLLEAVGEPLSTRGLPLAFARADLRSIHAWRTQIAAAERLARDGVLDATTLMGLYTRRAPAASGGVWDRVAAVQALDVALSTGDAQAVARTLDHARQEMRKAGLEPVLGRLVTARLARLTLPPSALANAYELSLMSGSPRAFLPPPEGMVPNARLDALGRVASGTWSAGMVGLGPREHVLAASLAADAPDPQEAATPDDGRLGEALLAAIATLAPGADGDADDLARALQVLLDAGLDATARHAVLQMALAAPHG